jgi:predicted ABC-type ATPase
MSPFVPEAAATRAGKLVLSEIRYYAVQRVSFAFETTLSGRNYLRLMRNLRRIGYRVHIFFLWIDTVDISSARISERVLKGGHDVPEAVQRRRFVRSIKNFLIEYSPLADSWYLFDNSGVEPERIASREYGKLRIMRPDKYSALAKRYGGES